MDWLHCNTATCSPTASIFPVACFQCCCCCCFFTLSVFSVSPGGKNSKQRFGSPGIKNAARGFIKKQKLNSYKEKCADSHMCLLFQPANFTKTTCIKTLEHPLHAHTYTQIARKQFHASLAKWKRIFLQQNLIMSACQRSLKSTSILQREELDIFDSERFSLTHKNRQREWKEDGIRPRQFN